MYHSAISRPGLGYNVALVATDFTTSSDRALRRALILSRQQVGAILLTHVVASPAAGRVRNSQTPSRQLDRLREGVSSVDQVSCSAILHHGNVAEGIASVARDREADLILLGPHHRRPLADAWQPSLAETLARKASVPILVANALPASPYHRAIFATDLREIGAEFLQTIEKAVGPIRSNLSFLHVYDDLAQQMLRRSLASGPDRQSLAEEQQSHARSALASWMRTHEMGGRDCLTLASKGCTATQIAEAAEQQDADLIIMPSFSKSYMERLIVGSTIARLLKGTAKDVLIVPAEPE